MDNLIERLQHMADDAMGMEPEDRRAILEAITELGKLGEALALIEANGLTPGLSFVVERQEQKS